MQLTHCRSVQIRGWYGAAWVGGQLYKSIVGKPALCYLTVCRWAACAGRSLHTATPHLRPVPTQRQAHTSAAPQSRDYQHGGLLKAQGLCSHACGLLRQKWVHQVPYPCWQEDRGKTHGHVSAALCTLRWPGIRLTALHCTTAFGLRYRILALQHSGQ